MLFSPLNLRQPLKLQPNKRQKRARLSNIMCVLFSSLGLVIFWIGFQFKPSQFIMRKHFPHPKSTLPKVFRRPEPHLLLSHATVPQVDAYVNATTYLGSMRYEESTSCKSYGSCEIHLPYVDLEESRLTPVELSSASPSHYAVLTRKGFKSFVTNVNANQDRAFVISPLELDKDTNLDTSPDDFMMGLFDGHGPVGHGTSHFAAMELPPLILRNMKRRKKFIHSVSDHNGVKAALKDSFHHLDENIPFLETSGSTGIIVLRMGTHLFLASTGDSQAFLVRADISISPQDETNNDGAVTIVRTTIPHKPDDPLESARIHAAGGRVMPKLSDETSSRVVIPVEGQPDMSLALAMSRSLGDPEGKKANVIIADPNVDIIDLDELRYTSSANSKFFLVVASDGLLDKIPPLGVVQRIAQSFYQERPPKPLVACHELIQQASQMWMPDGNMMGYRDDISIAVKMLDL